MDVLVPKIGEIIGGSQREDDFDVLTQRMADMNVPVKGLEWYLELRKYGTCPHAGFGLGFERLIMYVTGIENIRDVIPFPRWPGNAGSCFCPPPHPPPLPLSCPCQSVSSIMFFADFAPPPSFSLHAPPSCVASPFPLLSILLSNVKRTLTLKKSYPLTYLGYRPTY
jgi:hypothetical protein